jgi:hypothetical protein
MEGNGPCGSDGSVRCCSSASWAPAATTAGRRPPRPPRGRGRGRRCRCRPARGLRHRGGAQRADARRPQPLDRGFAWAAQPARSRAPRVGGGGCPRGRDGRHPHHPQRSPDRPARPGRADDHPHRAQPRQQPRPAHPGRAGRRGGPISRRHRCAGRPHPNRALLGGRAAESLRGQGAALPAIAGLEAAVRKRESGNMAAR